MESPPGIDAVGGEADEFDAFEIEEALAIGERVSEWTPKISMKLPSFLAGAETGRP